MRKSTLKTLVFCSLLSLILEFSFPLQASAFWGILKAHAEGIKSEIDQKMDDFGLGKNEEEEWVEVDAAEHLKNNGEPPSQELVTILQGNTLQMAYNPVTQISKACNKKIIMRKIRYPKRIAIARPKPKPGESWHVLTTAYSSTRDQTDSNPFITASGTRVHDGTIAINTLPFGTKVKFPEVFGDKVFTVEDRMGSNHKADIWFPTREQALKFGAKKIKIEVVK